ncbi:MAG: hypothetical protein HOB37_07760 [Rhodospirillaceae bacterium]|nr:hypothetical protein [Rhodospirillaceae bacterium]
MNALRLFVLLATIAAALPATASTLAPIELAARPAGGEIETDKEPSSGKTAGQRWRSGKSVQRLQRAPADLGLYLGPIDGHLNVETRGAIRVYQQGAGLKTDGKISRELLNLLQNAVEVRALLKRLDKARKSGKDAARDAPLSHPATRDLVSAANTERADPTRDSAGCLGNPTVRCLLNEASESVKAVFRPELRDWALGEILVTQARAGLTEYAMLTARRLRDPRLIMVALRDIAEAVAAAGMSGEALEAAKIIPDLDKRIEAIAAIAKIQIRAGKPKEARRSTGQLLIQLKKIKDDIKRISYRAKAAVILAEAGDLTRANRQMVTAEKNARARTEDAEKGLALRYVASALADMQRPDQALKMLDDITSASERTSVLVSAANAQARTGDAAAALATADNIEEVRFRAVVLGHVALAQAQKGQSEAAEATLQIALAAVENIKIPFARSYAISRIALAMVRLAKLGGAKEKDAATALTPLSYEKARETAALIDDNRLRAQTLWVIAEAQRRAVPGGSTDDAPNADAGVKETEKQAEAATAAIVSRLSRVWMFGDMADTHARRKACSPAKKTKFCQSWRCVPSCRPSRGQLQQMLITDG